MAKIDKSLYSKEEFHRLREEKKQKKLQTKYNIVVDNNNKKNILCLKHGDKYNFDYVNKLFNGVKKYLQSPFNFFCITDNPKHLHKDIQVIPLPNLETKGWWFKTFLFSNDLPISGTILYIDLDVVITNNLEKLFSYNPGQFLIVRDFNRILRPNYPKFNSSVMRFEKGSLSDLWIKFHSDYKNITRRFFGDQDFIYNEKQGVAEFFPNDWILSWKWEIRKSKTFASGGIKGFKKFQIIENVEPPIDCCIAVFHGDPNPHLCEDPYIIKQWQ